VLVGGNLQVCDYGAVSPQERKEAGAGRVVGIVGSVVGSVFRASCRASRGGHGTQRPHQRGAVFVAEAEAEAVLGDGGVDGLASVESEGVGGAVAEGYRFLGEALPMHCSVGRCRRRRTLDCVVFLEEDEVEEKEVEEVVEERDVEGGAGHGGGHGPAEESFSSARVELAY
jgi:hypothetical protein